MPKSVDSLGKILVTFLNRKISYYLHAGQLKDATMAFWEVDCIGWGPHFLTKFPLGPLENNRLKARALNLNFIGLQIEYQPLINTVVAIPAGYATRIFLCGTESLGICDAGLDCGPKSPKKADFVKKISGIFI